MNTSNKRAKKHSDDIAFNHTEKIDKNHVIGVNDRVNDSVSSYSDINDEDNYNHNHHRHINEGGKVPE